MITVGKNETRFVPIALYSSSERSESRSLEGRSRQARTIKGLVVLDRPRTINIDVVLAGERASVEVVGLVIGVGSDDKTLEVNITHAAPKTKSIVKVKGVLRGRSKFDFRGNVKIEKGAKGSDAYLRSDVLLFDEAKMGDDTPALEILEPDVKAGHAATVGKVDENMIFYLMSRGLTRNKAERMIIEGFVGPMRDVIASKAKQPENKILKPFDLTQGQWQVQDDEDEIATDSSNPRNDEKGRGDFFDKS